jgi:phosphoadenosine phosphosulfate reductase
MCLACGSQGHNIAPATLVPVFRPEINFLKKHVSPDLHSYFKELETWVTPRSYTYYYQGKPFLKMSAAMEQFNKLSPDKKINKQHRSQREMLLTFRKANKDYIERLQYEAENFIRSTVARFNQRPIMVSFSGGKDSTVVSHLVMSALGRSDILHIFADTTIELPDTYKYIKKFQRIHPLTPMITSRASLDFFSTAKSIGPPSRILRWCCTTHKTNPLSKIIDGISPDYGALTFDGIRKAESARRAKYSPISKQNKIAREVLASPILEWTDFDVWAYLFYHGLPFNYAYNYGFRRVGCLYCPFNSIWSQRMIKYRYPKKNNRWNRFLKVQAHRMRHPNPEVFIKHGWRARAGGRGLEHYKTSIESAPCLLADNALSYQILSGDIRQTKHFLRPLGPQSQIHSNGYSEAFLIHNHESDEIMASVEVSFEDNAIRVNYLLLKYQRLFRQRIEKQLKKLQSCLYCGACSAKCSVKALESEEAFFVDTEKCVSCLSCVKHKCPAVESLTKKGKQ